MATSAGWFWEIHPLLGGKGRSYWLKERREWKWKRGEIGCHFLHNQAVLFLLFHPETQHRVQCESITQFHIKPTTPRITIQKDVQIRVNHLPESQCIQELRESPFLPIVILIAGLLTSRRRRRRSNQPLVDDIASCCYLWPVFSILARFALKIQKNTIVLVLLYVRPIIKKTDAKIRSWLENLNSKIAYTSKVCMNLLKRKAKWSILLLYSNVQHVHLHHTYSRTRKSGITFNTVQEWDAEALWRKSSDELKTHTV